MKYVVLTVDDRLIFNYTIVAPILKEYGLRCTFFITAKPDLWRDLRGYGDMNWKQCLELHNDGFEIGNHTYGHFPITHGIDRFKQEIMALDNFLMDLGIDKPVSFAYPGYLFDDNLDVEGQKILKSLGFKYARVGYPVDQWHYDIANREYTPYYNPKIDNPLHLHCTGVLNKDYKFEHFKQDIEQMPDKHVAILCTHYVESSLEINRLHQICRYIVETPNVEMCRLKDVQIG